VNLTKAGITKYWRAPGSDEAAVVRPSSARELLRFWHERLSTIDDDYTFGDLIALLRGVDDIDLLSPLLACDVPAFLEEASGPHRPDTDKPTMQFVRVYNVTQLERYEPDPAQPDEPLEWLDDDEAAEQDRVDTGVSTLMGEPKSFRIVDATGDDSITGEPALRRIRAGEMHGSWKPPYDVRREFDGRGRQREPHAGYFARHPEIDPGRYEGSYALDFSPLSTLLHLPLRYDSAAEFWSKPYDTGELRLRTEITITFGEFLHAIFWELGFFGSPTRREDAREAVETRAAKIDDIAGDCDA
jgi:hypothetical protein